MSTGRDLTELVCPPRSLFVNFPMGNPFGAPHESDYQRTLLRTALELVESATKSGEIVDLNNQWTSDFTDDVAASLLSVT